MNDTQKDVFELARKWKSAHLLRTGGKDYFADQRNVEFFHALRERNLLISSTLRASGRLLSAWLGFIYQGSWSGWVFAYDPDPHLRKYSVGRQLLHEMLEESYRRGHREFDFSRSAHDYKTLYATRVRLLGTEGRPPLRVRAARRSRAI